MDHVDSLGVTHDIVDAVGMVRGLDQPTHLDGDHLQGVPNFWIGALLQNFLDLRHSPEVIKRMAVDLASLGSQLACGIFAHFFVLCI